MSAQSEVRQNAISSVHLDAIRGAAAMIVLLGHTRELFFSSITGTPTTTEGQTARLQTGQQLANKQVDYVTIGNEAVIIFFVLSGYLVGGSAIRDFKAGRWSWKKYLTKRATRLWIVLLPALLFGVLLDHAGLREFAGTPSVYSCPPGQYLVPCNLVERLAPKVIVANVFFLQSVVTDTAGSNNALWSLANEFWYYIAFPLGILVLQKGRPLGRRLFYAIALCGIGVIVGKSICLLFLLWLLGAVVSLMPLELSPGISRRITGVLPIVLPLTIVLVKFCNLRLYLGQWVVALVFAAGLYVILHRTEPASGGLYKSLAGFFSRMSYTLYLVHLPLAVFLCAYINNPWHPWSKSRLHLAQFFLLNLALIFFSYGFYLLFEANTDRIRMFLFFQQKPASREPYTMAAKPNNLMPGEVSEASSSR